MHALTAARTHGLIDALISANVTTFADKACQGAGGSIRTPFKYAEDSKTWSGRSR